MKKDKDSPDDLDAKIEAVADEMKPVCRTNLLPGEAHTFVNLDLLYRQLEPQVGKLRKNVSWVARFLADDSFKSIWMPENAKNDLKAVMDYYEGVIEATEEIIRTLNAFKRKGLQKPAIDNTSGKHKIGHVKVIKGALYLPSDAVTIKPDDLLSGEFNTWRKQQNPEVST